MTPTDAPLTCPYCKGRLDLTTGPVTHPWGEPDGKGNVFHAYVWHEAFVACTRCEFAETVAALLEVTR